MKNGRLACPWSFPKDALQMITNGSLGLLLYKQLEAAIVKFLAWSRLPTLESAGLGI